MAATKQLVRVRTHEFNTGTDAVPAWTPIKGITSTSHSDASSDVDTTDYDSMGISEHMVAERGESWTISGKKLIDAADGTGDPGQEAVEALAREVGVPSIGQFRFTYPGGATETFYASAKVTKPGGGNNDTMSWSVVLRVSGAPTLA